MNNNISKAAELLEFIKDRLVADLNEAKAKNLFTLEQEEFSKLIRFAKISIDNNFAKSAETIFK